MAYKTETFLIQTGLKSLGYDFGPKPSKYGPLDGIEGPKTRAAIAAFEGASSQAGSVAERMVQIALKDVGIRETSRNRGPGIEKYWGATTYPNGYQNREPYCAAFICWVMREAMNDVGEMGFSRYRSPVAYDVEKWARSQKGKGVQIFNYNDKPLKPGDIFTLKAASHVGMIEKVSGRYVHTIEGNTDGSGSREGDGVYRRRRTASGFRKVIRIA